MKTLSAIALGVVAAATFIGTAASPVRAQQKDIVDTAVAAGSFNTLAAALQAAGLIETLKGKGPFTVFAPTDAAFAKLPAGTVESLLTGKSGEAAPHSDLPRRVWRGEVRRRRDDDVRESRQR
jgi:uncharacterized surface protein with fasciclin (FAS1) repeats